MPYSEYESWRQFYLLYPFDDYHRHYRPAALLASLQTLDRNRGLQVALDWLQPDPVMTTLPDTDRQLLTALGIRRAY